jgi:hypothetical protein
VQNLRVVREGLSAGDRVVIEGLQRVRAGSPVTPEEGRIEPPEPQPGAPWSPQT